MRTRRDQSSMIAACAVLAAAWLVAPVAAAADAVSFARDIKPLLARRCFACHGPTASEGGLRLDAPEGAVAELDSGLFAIVPGDVAASELVARVSAEDESLRMP